MDRRTFVTTAAAAAASSLLPGAARAQATKVKNVVLIHGLFADGSCWLDVISRVQAKGLRATAVQNPLTSLQAGVEATLVIVGGPGTMGLPSGDTPFPISGASGAVTPTGAPCPIRPPSSSTTPTPRWPSRS